MKILAIETSCDETSVSILEATGQGDNLSFSILGNKTLSQIDIHKEFGGVYPTLAKREHGKNLVPITLSVLKEANMLIDSSEGKNEDILSIMDREPELQKEFEKIFKIKKPEIDLICVTSGPGLEPALWVGINFGKALSKLWDIPLRPVNHMKGHVFSFLVDEKLNEKQKDGANKISFPALSLLISGGHTELVLIRDWDNYEVIGETVDDAVGEAFDKVARILGLPYPGGPEISKLAESGKENWQVELPRPMLHSKNYNFSFSGLKTAVLYLVKDLGQQLTEDIKKDIAFEFENAVIEVLKTKTERAIKEHGIKTLVVGGGVAANKRIRESLKNISDELNVLFPGKGLSTDNSIMIGLAGYIDHVTGKTLTPIDEIKADSSLSF